MSGNNNAAGGNVTCPDPDEDMTAISTLLSPLSTAEGVVLIYSTKRQVLQLELRYLGGNALTTLGWADKTAPVPKLANPSSLVAMQNSHVTCVYGMTYNPTNGYKIALISPVYQPVEGGKPKTGSLTGTSTDEGRYLYYQGTTAGGETKIMEFFQFVENQSFIPLDTSPILSGTNLFAFRHEELNWVVYQLKDKNTIALYNVKSKKESPIPGSGALAREKTPVTACVVPAAGARKARVYIYFIDKEFKVISANAEMADTLAFVTKDEKPSEVTELGQGQNTITAETWSQLSVQPCKGFPVPEGRNTADNVKSPNASIQECNVLFVLKSDTSKISQVPCDAWPRRA